MLCKIILYVTNCTNVLCKNVDITNMGVILKKLAYALDWNTMSLTDSEKHLCVTSGTHLSLLPVNTDNNRSRCITNF